MTPEELYEENQPLVWFTLKKYFPSLKVDEDVLQVCRIGLWQACAEYYPEKELNSQHLRSRAFSWRCADISEIAASRRSRHCR